jgi:flagellar biosynthesis/type III secretory pathway chaperone
MPKAPPAKATITSPVLREFDTLLETLIELQRKEQALILARKTDELATTTQSIEWMGVRLQSMEVDVRRELDRARKNDGAPQSHIQEKLAQIKRLAQQNHTLLEHSLFFLQQLFQQVMERDTPLHLYNANGHSFRSDLGGGLLETRI